MSETSAVVAPPPSETTEAPSVEAQMTRRAELTHRIVGTRARELQGKPADTPKDKALAVYGKIMDYNGGETITYRKADASKGEKDLRLPGFQAEDTDSEGKPVTVTFKPNEWRIAQITGVVDADDPNSDLECVIENDAGEQVPAPVPREWALSGQLLAQRPEFEEALADDPTAQKFVLAHTDALPQNGDKAPTGEFPDDATYTTLEDKYILPEPPAADPESKEKPQTPLDKARDRVDLSIKKLEGKGETLSKIEQALLTDLKLAQDIVGEWGPAFTKDALARLQKELPDPTGKDASEFQSLQKLMDAIQPLAKKAETAFSKLLLDGLGPEKVQEMAKIAAEPGGMLKLLQDPDLTAFLSEAKGTEVCKGLFGKDMTGQEIKAILEKANLPPELKELVEKGDKMSLLKLLLILTASVTLAPLAGGVVGGLGLVTGAQTFGALAKS